jgi:hypothetical protein
MRARLLKQLVAVISLLLPSGAMASGPVGAISDAPAREMRLVIDLSAGTATTEEWRSEIVDCSDQQYFCALIPNRMVLSFARRCSDATREGRPPTRYGDLLRVAPTPHLAPPSGSYVVRTFPNVLLFYYVGNGLVEGEGLVQARVLRHSPFEEEFDANDYLTTFTISTRGGRGLFACS